MFTPWRRASALNRGGPGAGPTRTSTLGRPLGRPLEKVRQSGHPRHCSQRIAAFTPGVDITPMSGSLAGIAAPVGFQRTQGGAMPISQRVLAVSQQLGFEPPSKVGVQACLRFDEQRRVRPGLVRQRIGALSQRCPHMVLESQVRFHAISLDCCYDERASTTHCGSVRSIAAPPAALSWDMPRSRADLHFQTPDKLLTAVCELRSADTVCHPYAALTQLAGDAAQSFAAQAAEGWQRWDGELRRVSPNASTSPAVIGRCTVYCFPSDMERDEFCRMTGSRAATLVRVSASGR